MAYLNDLKMQHGDIREIIGFIKTNLEENKIRPHAAQLAQNINILAGKLKIHLMSEDDSLYPKLLGSSDVRVKETAERFSLEMGNLSEVFTEYKVKYNISSRILNNVEEYIRDTKAIIGALENRINREDKELYVLL